MLTRAGEHPRHEARRHGVVLLRPFAVATGLAAAGALALARGWPLSVVGALAFAAGAVRALGAVVRWERTRVVVTSDALYVVDGVLRRRAAAVRLPAAGPIEVEQSLPGRLLGYGTLMAGDLEIPFVVQPARLAALVSER